MINLLIVDDDTSLLSSLSEIFERLGYSVQSARDGFTALSEIRLKIPDILLSDLNLPGLSSYEMLSVVRERFPSIRTIAMGGAVPGDDLRFEVAADAVYEKGTGLDSLIRMVCTITQSERLPRLHTLGNLASSNRSA
jgi:CheY-like chemotaxis protein